MAILDKLKSPWRFMIPILLLAMWLAVPTKDVEKVLDHAKTAVESPINKARSFAQEAKKVYISREMYLPPLEPHTTGEKPPAKSPQSYTSFGIQTSQGGLSSPSPEYLKKHGLLLDNRDTCSAPAKHADTLTGPLPGEKNRDIISPRLAFIITVTVILVVMLHKLICYISNVASELAPTLRQDVHNE